MSVARLQPQATSDDHMVKLWLDNYTRSRETRRAYEGDMARFRAFAGMPLRDVTMRVIQEFGASLAVLAPATASRRLSAVKSLLGFAHRFGYLPFDVGAPIQLPVVRDGLAERILTEEQVHRLLYLERHPRNGALLRLIYGAGLRISEACGLRWRDLVARDDAGQVAVLGKGGKTRVILLPTALWSRVELLRPEPAEPDDPVFRSRLGRAVSRSQVDRIMKRAAKRAGLPPSVSTHFLRHAHVSHALDRGAPAHVVQQTVGHSSLATTSHYAHVRPGDSSARYLAA